MPVCISDTKGHEHTAGEVDIIFPPKVSESPLVWDGLQATSSGILGG